MDIKSHIEEILEKFLLVEKDLLVNDSNEPAISHRLATLLEKEFSDWNVDCEYNRSFDTVKRLRYAIEPNGNVEERNVVPDIIIHHRMTEDNLLAIEIKKTTNSQDNYKDLAKLQAFREQLNYQHCLFIRFKTGETKPSLSDLRWL